LNGLPREWMTPSCRLNGLALFPKYPKKTLCCHPITKKNGFTNIYNNPQHGFGKFLKWRRGFELEWRLTKNIDFKMDKDKPIWLGFNLLKRHSND